ncbi:hypothetical protein INR49_008094 [Caranx melampygus]|nr:hypothetical protein INR49_008094 [Caranx melampygus]
MEINEADFRWQRHVLSQSSRPGTPASASASASGATERSPDISISITTETARPPWTWRWGARPGHTTLRSVGGRPSPITLVLQRSGWGAWQREGGGGARGSAAGGGAAREGEGRAEKEGGRGGRGEEKRREKGGWFLQCGPEESRPRLPRHHQLPVCGVQGQVAPHGGVTLQREQLHMEERTCRARSSTPATSTPWPPRRTRAAPTCPTSASDNVSLADWSSRRHVTVRVTAAPPNAAMSLKLLRNQEADQQSARLFVQALAALLPRLLGLSSTTEVDLSLQNFSSTFCSGLQAGGIHSPGFKAGDTLSCQSLMNGDGLYLVSSTLCCSTSNSAAATTTGARSPPPTSAGLDRGALSPGVLERNLLAEAGYWGSPEDHGLPLITMLTDIDGLGSSAIGGQLIRRASSQSPLSCSRAGGDTVMAGSSRGLTFILGTTEGAKEQSQREETPSGVRLHTAHVLCMDAILNVGLEMGSHNHNCWPHVFRVTEYISTLEHTHFSDGFSQPSSLTTITQHSSSSSQAAAAAAVGVDLGLELSCESGPEAQSWA